MALGLLESELLIFLNVAHIIGAGALQILEPWE